MSYKDYKITLNNKRTMNSSFFYDFFLFDLNNYYVNLYTIKFRRYYET